MAIAIYVGHQFTDEMLSETQTVFLVDRETKVCFAYLVRFANAQPSNDWSVWKHNAKTMTDQIVETARTYEACLMMLGARSPGLLLNFEVWYSKTRMPWR